MLEYQRLRARGAPEVPDSQRLMRLLSIAQSRLCVKHFFDRSQLAPPLLQRLVALLPSVEQWMELDVIKADAHLSVGSVWANHCDSAKRVVLGGLNELKDFIVS